MTDPERDHFRRQVRELEGGVRRWKAVAAALAVCLALALAAGGLSGVLLVGRLEVARQEQMRAMEYEMRARAQAEEQRHQAEQARRKAEGQRRQQP